MSTPPRDPETDDQWREAINLADAMLSIDSAWIYGLITGGPEVDVERCREMIRRGKAKGIIPNDEEVIEMVRTLVVGTPGMVLSNDAVGG